MPQYARAVLAATLSFFVSVAANAADYPAPKEADWIAKDFKFHTGHVMPELKLHYTTIGAPSGQPVLVLHGTGGSAQSMLTPAFAGELFGEGQALDASSITSSFPMALAMENHRSHRTACAPRFRNTITTTWWMRSIV